MIAPASTTAPPKRNWTPSRELGLVLLTLLLLVGFYVLFPQSWKNFATFDNFASVVRNLAFEGILALGMMLMFEVSSILLRRLVG